MSAIGASRRYGMSRNLSETALLATGIFQCIVWNSEILRNTVPLAPLPLRDDRNPAAGRERPGFRGNAPTVCIAQSNGLGKQPKNESVGPTARQFATDNVDVG